MNGSTYATIPTKWGEFKLYAYDNNTNNWMPDLALVHPEIEVDKVVSIRIHSECLTGDLFHSKRCDCGEQLDKALSIIHHEKGILIYLRQEGRGIGIINKLKAYNLQDSGLNTIEANEQLGLEVDAREYSTAINILKKLKVNRIKLLTNNPLKINAFKDSGIEVVERVPVVTTPISENKSYLLTKQNLMGHQLDL